MFTSIQIILYTSFFFVVYCSVKHKQLLIYHSFDAVRFDDNAVCNDGTRGGYYYAPAVSSTQQSIYVIYLPGGGQCFDEASCASRNASRKSSVDAPSSRYLGGVLDSDEEMTHLWGAHKASLLYCSSDGYMGNMGASSSTWNMHFRGQVLVRSFLRALLLDHGMLQRATKVFLVGSSSGGRGLMTMIDDIVHNVLPPSIEVVGFFESPYYLDINSPTSTSNNNNYYYYNNYNYNNNNNYQGSGSNDFKGFLYQEHQKYLLFNTSAIISNECFAVYPSDPWKCQMGQYRMPFVKTPFFLVASQFDSYQLMHLTGSTPEHYDTSQVLFTERFSSLHVESIGNLSTALMMHHHYHHHLLQQQHYDYHSIDTVVLVDDTSPSYTRIHREGGRGKGGYGIVTLGCYDHSISPTDKFNTIYSSSSTSFVSLKIAFEQYLRELAYPSVLNSTWVLHWMDECHSIDCATSCSVFASNNDPSFYGDSYSSDMLSFMESASSP